MVEHGDPRDVICEVAEKIKPQVLVMGSHGYGLIKRYACSLKVLEWLSFLLPLVPALYFSLL